MSLLAMATNQQTVTVATEVALAQLTANSANIPSGAQAAINGSVSCAAGTGGTTMALKIRQGSGTGGTQVGPTYTGPAQTANAAQIGSIQVVDPAPPSSGIYTLTLTFTGNSSSVVNSSLVAEFAEGALA